MRCSLSRYYSDEEHRRHIRKIAKGKFFEVPIIFEAESQNWRRKSVASFDTNFFKFIEKIVTFRLFLLYYHYFF